jgi:uncharacterized protein (TIGR02147 family)
MKKYQPEVHLRGNDLNARNEQPTSAPVITGYHDYHAYLNDWFAWKKKTTKKFSLRAFAKQAGVSCAYLPRILNGQRKLSEKVMEKILPHMDLTRREKSYFRLLQRLEASKSVAESSAILHNIHRFREYADQNAEEFEVHKYLSKWYYVAIREMATSPDFQMDARWIQKRLKRKVALTNIESALKFLLAHGFIAATKEGASQAPKTLHCMDGIFALSLNDFYRQMLGISLEAIEEKPESGKSITGVTLSVPKKNQDRLVEILYNARKEIMSLESSGEEGDKVIQVCLTAVPLSKASERPEKRRRA